MRVTLPHPPPTDSSPVSTLLEVAKYLSNTSVEYGTGMLTQRATGRKARKLPHPPFQLLAVNNFLYASQYSY